MKPRTVSKVLLLAAHWSRWREAIGRRALGLRRPAGASDWRPSVIASLEDDPASQHPPELGWILGAVARAAGLALREPAERSDSRFFNVFPGEHYRLLAGVLQQLQPQLVLDIGTYTGMSARVICDHSPATARIHSFDLLPWNSFASHLNPADFQGQRLQQHLENLADPTVFQRFLPLVDQADLIFCDAPKDGVFEPAFLALLASAPLSTRPRWLLLDDIRFLQMVNCWRSIASPKLDLTSFGHWSGTGLVDISQGLRLHGA